MNVNVHITNPGEEHLFFKTSWIWTQTRVFCGVQTIGFWSAEICISNISLFYLWSLKLQLDIEKLKWNLNPYQIKKKKHCIWTLTEPDHLLVISKMCSRPLKNIFTNFCNSRSTAVNQHNYFVLQIEKEKKYDHP